MKKDTRDRSEYQRKRREMFPELFRERHRQWRHKSPENLKKHNENSRKWREENREWVREYDRKWREKNREKLRSKDRARQGIPDPTRPEPTACECCGGGPRGRGSFHVDHDHKTGKFRGWLCWRCNSAIGHLGDDIAGIERALAYLKLVSS